MVISLQRITSDFCGVLFRDNGPEGMEPDGIIEVR